MDDYFEQVHQVIAARQAARSACAPSEPVADLETLSARQVAEEAGWAAFAANLEALDPVGKQPLPSGAAAGPISAALLAKLLEPPSSPSGIPSSILAGTPHIAALASSSSLTSAHMQKTATLRKLFRVDKDADAVVDLLRAHMHPDSFAHSLWRLIVQDQYMDFEKLFASFGSSPNHHNDEPKDFGGGFALVRKDQLSARKTLRSESDWTRCFDAWSRGVGLVYPHHIEELSTYRTIVIEFFRAAEPDISFPIRFDRQARERYAKSPYELHDRTYLNFSLLSEMLHAPTASTSSKRTASAESVSSPPAKRRRVLCQNWNLGKCSKTPCPGGRVHGTCTECGGKHAACDKPACLILLNAKRAVAYGREGAGSSGST